MDIWRLNSSTEFDRLGVAGAPAGLGAAIVSVESWAAAVKDSARMAPHSIRILRIRTILPLLFAPTLATVSVCSGGKRVSMQNGRVVFRRVNMCRNGTVQGKRAGNVG